MNKLEQVLKKLVNTNTKFYSALAVVMTTYRVKDVNERGETYNAVNHLTCDVRMVSDDTILYGVKLTPAILKVDSAGNITDAVYDGSPESRTGTVKADVPLVGSYVFITWLDEENAFVSMNTQTNSFVIGSSEGAYIDFYVADESNIIELINCTEFKVQFPNGKTFNLKFTEGSTSIAELVVLLDSIRLNISAAEILMNDAGIEFNVTNAGKISIKNDLENLKDLLIDFISEFITYLNTVAAGLAVAVPPVNVVPIVTNLTTLRGRVSTLLV